MGDFAVASSGTNSSDCDPSPCHGKGANSLRQQATVATEVDFRVVMEGSKTRGSGLAGVRVRERFRAETV